MLSIQKQFLTRERINSPWRLSKWVFHKEKKLRLQNGKKNNRPVTPSQRKVADVDRTCWTPFGLYWLPKHCTSATAARPCSKKKAIFSPCVSLNKDITRISWNTPETANVVMADKEFFHRLCASVRGLSCLTWDGEKTERWNMLDIILFQRLCRKNND